MASTNFQILEVLNFLPLKFGGSTENFRRFSLRRDFIETHRYVFCFVCAFSWTSSTEHSWVYYDCGFHGYLHCFVLIIFIGKFDALCQFFLFFFLPFFFFSVLNFQGCIKSFLVFLFFNWTKRGKCAFTPQKYTHLRLHLRKCSCFSWHDRLCRTCVLTGRRIQASQTGLTKHLGSVNGSSRGSQTKVFVSLSAAEADQKRQP